MHALLMACARLTAACMLWGQAVQGRGEAERGQGYRKLWQQVTKVRPATPYVTSKGPLAAP